ncbi:MAG TPA: hypothetical protein VGL29_20585 [Blastocatellia bacterium]
MTSTQGERLSARVAAPTVAAVAGVVAERQAKAGGPEDGNLLAAPILIWRRELTNP